MATLTFNAPAGAKVNNNHDAVIEVVGHSWTLQDKAGRVTVIEGNGPAPGLGDGRESPAPWRVGPNGARRFQGLINIEGPAIGAGVLVVRAMPDATNDDDMSKRLDDLAEDHSSEVFEVTIAPMSFAETSVTGPTPGRCIPQRLADFPEFADANIHDG